MEIVEPKRDNSGMLHGTLVKRHRFLNGAAPGKLLSPADLRIGETFRAYGKTFALTACDAFTRVCKTLLVVLFLKVAIKLLSVPVAGMSFWQQCFREYDECFFFCEGLVQQLKPRPAC